MQRDPSDVTPEEILAFWFPSNLIDGDPQVFADYRRSRMRGGMDQAIIDTYADVTHAAARGTYDHWAQTAYGRLALLLVIDQFPRSLWRDTPGAYGQDIKSCLLTLEALENGHFDALAYPWEKVMHIVVLCHCEGPDHLARMDLAVEVAETRLLDLDSPWAHLFGDVAGQPRRVRDVIARFGRHPHRNAILARVSTPAEEAYVAEGDFPHARKVPDPS